MCYEAVATRGLVWRYVFRLQAGRQAPGRRHAQVAEESQQTEAAQLEATVDAAVASS